VGRNQAVDEQYIELDNDDTTSGVRVYQSYLTSTKLDRQDDRLEPQPADVLIQAIESKDEFSGVLRGWFARTHSFNEARWRFHSSFIQGNRFPIDRLIASANMFDLLPSEAAPDDVVLSDELNSAKQEAREIFKGLPRSYERDSILGALGRIGKASLKHKVRQRAEIITGIAPYKFPHLTAITREAVNCRNHFVHGSVSGIDYSAREDLIPFLTRSLEFVFAASDLVECGWDLHRFLLQLTSGSHPFGDYKAHYRTDTGEWRVLILF